MKDPARWRDADGGAGADVQALLRSDRLEAPSDAERDRVWSSLALELGATPSPPPPAGPIATAATGTLAIKLTVVVLAAATGTGVGWYGLHVRDAQRARHTATARVTSATAPAASLPASPLMPSTTTSIEGPAPTIPAPAAETGTRPSSASRRQAARWPAETRAAELGARNRDRRPLPESASGPGHRLLPTSHELPAGGVGARTSTVSSPARPWPATHEPPSRSEPEETPAGRTLGSSWGPSPWPTLAPAASGEAHATGSASRVPPPAEAATNELLEESRLLAKVRAALRAHDPDRALRLLDTARGTASLAQEREALTIEALAARPATRAAAVERARALLRAYPQSPYRARIKALLSQSP